ncbi:MAG: twin-arginine translocase subunit TatC [Prevotella sp.]|nr:twin-arginine translocase subunit TatC [Prevotella sp.]
MAMRWLREYHLIGIVVVFYAHEDAMQGVGIDFHFEEFHVEMIATDLSSQFMTHITTAVYLGLLGASPYILYELFRFISPALYENERKYSVQVAAIITPPDLMTLILVTIPLYLLYEVSIRVLKWVEPIG